MRRGKAWMAGTIPAMTWRLSTIDSGLKDRRVLITGGSQGIGYAIAQGPRQLDQRRRGAGRRRLFASGELVLKRRRSAHETRPGGTCRVGKIAYFGVTARQRGQGAILPTRDLIARSTSGAAGTRGQRRARGRAQADYRVTRLCPPYEFHPGSRNFGDTTVSIAAAIESRRRSASCSPISIR